MKPPNRLLMLVCCVCGMAAQAFASPPPLVELQVNDRKYEGKVAARNVAALWLMGRDGRLNIFKAGEVGTSRQIAPQFQGWNASIVKDQLRREFTRPYDVASSRHYVVVAAGDTRARRYADVLEDFFGTYQMYFSLRGFKVPEPEFPLVAIVFPSHDAFSKYALQDAQRMSAMVRGYYLTTSNRIAFYESDGDGVAHSDSGAQLPQFGMARDPGATIGDLRQFPQRATAAINSVQGSLKDTLIHEATHQAAYNTGLHSRIGENPLWMVEGLATVFEAPGVRNSRSNIGVKSRVNPERLVWFGNFARERRKPQSLEAFIARDDLFASNVLDAYSQAWALTFFLFETRPRNYAEFLRTVAARNPLEVYTPEARVADFKRAISSELKLLEAEFLRFMADLR